MNEDSKTPDSDKTNTSNTDTGGGANIGGDVTAGQNVTGRDHIESNNISTQNNYYNDQKQPNKPTDYQINSLVSQGIRAQLNGDIATAKSIFLRAKELDPDNHDLAKHIEFVKAEIKRPYVDSHGWVIENHLFTRKDFTFDGNGNKVSPYRPRFTRPSTYTIRIAIIIITKIAISIYAPNMWWTRTILLLVIGASFIFSFFRFVINTANLSYQVGIRQQ